MSTTPASRAGHPLARTVAIPTGVTAGVAGAWWLAITLDPSHVVHEVALFAHLACLTLCFGSVLAVDWVATLWLLRRRTFPDVLTAARNAHTLIWGGYAGLLASGVLLEPDPSDPLTAVKLVLVLVIGINSAAATAGVLSRLCWWSATAIGFLNAR